MLAGVGVASYFYFNVPNLSKKSTPSQLTKITIQDKTINDNTNPFVIKITYPEIAGLTDFNQKAKAIVDKEILDFKKNSLANDAAVKATDPTGYAQFPRQYELDISYDKGEIDNNITSVVFNIYNFEGGAHGASYFIPLNYDIKNKKQMVLDDLFPNQLNFLQKISDYCIKDLEKQMVANGSIDMSDNSWIQEGAGPKGENYRSFLINKNNIIFYFQQYQVAAGAAGDFKVTMPR